MMRVSKVILPDKTISKEDIIRWQKKEPKTNAMRMLERAKIPFEVHRYECKEFIDGITIADMLNEPYERVI